jgi:hypothetical protein
LSEVVSEVYARLKYLENAPAAAMSTPPTGPHAQSLHDSMASLGISQTSTPTTPTTRAVRVPSLSALRERVLYRVRRREGLLYVSDVEEWTDGGRDYSPVIRNSERRRALMAALQAYTPAPPIPYIEPLEDIEQPIPVAVTEEHELVCKTIDECDEYTGDLNVEPERDFFCPLSYSALRFPVSAPDGYVYEKSYLQASKKAASARHVPWCSPMTRAIWVQSTSFPYSAYMVHKMALWIKTKAIKVAGAAPTDDLRACAAQLREALATTRQKSSSPSDRL